MGAEAHASFMVPPPGHRAKDFSIIKHDGLYHLFYTRRNVNLPVEQSENDFGHAISWDLISWAQLDPVLPVRLDEWDNLHVWAPHVVESDGVFYLFYTGVTDAPGEASAYQRIGVATSTDLFTWNRSDEPLFSCEDVPWAYCNPLNGNTSFRDPYVMRNPQAPGEWWLYFTTSLDGDSTSMLMGRAVATSAAGPFADAGPLWITYETTTFSELSESVHLFPRNGLWHLMWTTNKVQPLVFATGPDPASPAAGWTYRGTLASMLGFDTSPWFASEHLNDGLIDYFAAASLTAIEILRIDWLTDITYQLVQPSLFHVRRMFWSKPVVAEGDTATLTIDATGWYGKSAELEVVEIDAGGAETLVANHHVGLPQSIPLPGNPTVYTWTARAIQDPDDGAPGPEIVVRLKDRTAAAPMVRIEPAAASGGYDPPGGGEDGFVLRFLQRSPVGSAFRIDLGKAADVRLEIFDIGGRKVRTLAEGRFGEGVHVVRFDGRRERLAAGVYFARLVAGAEAATTRFVVAP